MYSLVSDGKATEVGLVMTNCLHLVCYSLMVLKFNKVTVLCCVKPTAFARMPLSDAVTRTAPLSATYVLCWSWPTVSVFGPITGYSCLVKNSYYYVGVMTACIWEWSKIESAIERS